MKEFIDRFGQKRSNRQKPVPAGRGGEQQQNQEDGPFGTFVAAVWSTLRNFPDARRALEAALAAAAAHKEDNDGHDRR